MAITKTKEERAIKVKLDEASLAEYAKSVGAEMLELGKIKLAQKESNDEFKAQAKEKEDAVSKIIGIINSGEEEKIVTCDVEKDFGTETVRYYFKKELVEERPMTDEDRQGRLFDKPEKKSRKQTDDVTEVIKEETSKKTKRDASTSATVQ